MKAWIAVLLVLTLLLPLAGCGQEQELEPWEMPAVDAPPTPVRTPIPSFGGGSPERYVWNEADFLNMSLPGAVAARQENFTHRQTLALFPYNFLPSAVFGSSHTAYDTLSIKRTSHEVMLDENGELAEHAYVEFAYLPKSGKEDEGLYVMAELCSYREALDIYNGNYPHLILPEGESLRLSTWYLKEFALARVGEQRAAQLMKLTPASYFTDSQQRLSEDASFVPARQIFLTVTCGLKMSDEEFLAAVTELLGFSDGSEIVTPEPSRLPVFGEKGAA